MARNRYTNEQITHKLREAEIPPSQGQTSCILDAQLSD